MRATCLRTVSQAVLIPMLLSAVRSITARTPGANRSTVYRVRLWHGIAFLLRTTMDSEPTCWRFAVGLPGDFNNNGVVDAADYVLWRDHLGDASEAALNGNGDGMNGIDAGDFDWWRAHFGNTTGSGSAVLSVTVPEPTTLALLALSTSCIGFRRALTMSISLRVKSPLVRWPLGN